MSLYYFSHVTEEQHNCNYGNSVYTRKNYRINSYAYIDTFHTYFVLLYFTSCENYILGNDEMGFFSTFALLLTFTRWEKIFEKLNILNNSETTENQI